MDTRSEEDDDFNDIYKEYTGPTGSKPVNTHEDRKPKKRSYADSDEEKEPPDLNAVPTDFTSREAKVWEAKSRATERNWKKRKEEEMICKLCGESGHFTQGCPQTLGANRKSQDFFERIAVRDRHSKSLFTEKAVSKIERGIGCKIKIEEKFIIVSGRDRLVLAKGVDAVHNVMNDEGSKACSNRSRSPETSNPSRSKQGRSDSFSNLKNASHNQSRYNSSSRHEKVLDDRGHDDSQRTTTTSPQGRNHSKSPASAPYRMSSFGTYGNGWRPNESVYELEQQSAVPQTLDDLQVEYKKAAMEIEQIREKEEGEEAYRHAEAMRESRESHAKKLSALRVRQAGHWDEFFQRAQHQTKKMIASVSGFTDYGHQHHHNHHHPSYGDYSSNSIDHYPTSLPQDFQRQRRDGFEKSYNRYS